VGYKGGSPKKKGQYAHVVIIPSNQGGFVPQLNHDELEIVRSFLSNTGKQTGISSLTYSSELPFFIGLNVSNTPFMNHWILDFRTTNLETIS